MAPAATVPGQTVRQQAKSASKDVVKPTLASPFSVPWPSLPNHLQNAVMAAMPEIFAGVADYHISRTRAHHSAKRAARRRGDAIDPNAQEPHKRPARPEMLDHLVLGLNETIKALENSIDDLRFRMALLAELNAPPPAQPSANRHGRYLPTQPPAETEEKPATPSKPTAPLAFVLVPHTSVTPFALIEHLPTTAATYNTLLRQAKRYQPAPPPAWFEDLPEIAVVPLGRREAELAAESGLRRLASFAVRSSHPSFDTLRRLLPRSILTPPTFSMTLPWPATGLAVHEEPPKADRSENVETTASTKTPLPVPVQYAPLHIKAISTTAPTNPTERKQKRLAEVRAKRVESKEKRREARKALERSARADILRHKAKPGGRAARRAAKQAGQAVQPQAISA